MKSSADERLERDRHTYELLCNFIEQALLMPNQYDRSILDQYVNPRPRPVEMAGIYERLLVRAKNKGHGKRAIEKVCGSPVRHNSDEISEFDKELRRKWQVFREVLCNFQPSMIAKTFNASKLRDKCVEALGPFEVGRHLCLFLEQQLLARNGSLITQMLMPSIHGWIR